MQTTSTLGGGGAPTFADVAVRNTSFVRLHFAGGGGGSRHGLKYFRRCRRQKHFFCTIAFCFLVFIHLDFIQTAAQQWFG